MKRIKEFLDWLYPQLIKSKHLWKVTLYAWGGLSLGLLLLLLVMAFLSNAPEEEEAPSPETAIQAPAVEAKVMADELHPAHPHQLPAMLAEGDRGLQLLHRHQTFQDPMQPKVILVLSHHLVQLPLFGPEPKSWKLALIGGNQVFLKQYTPQATADALISFDRQRGQTYGLQLARIGNRQWVEALALARRLQAQGYYAYLHRSKLREQLPGETSAKFLYRLRVGFFDSEDAALEAGAAIQKAFADEPLLQRRLLVTHPAYEEYGSPLVDGRATPSKPWMLTLSPTSLETAEEQLRALMDAAPFAYLTAKADKAGKTSYQVKAGFFETQELAESAMNRARQGSAVGFQQPSIHRSKLEIRSFNPPLAQLQDNSRILPFAPPAP